MAESVTLRDDDAATVGTTRSSPPPRRWPNASTPAGGCSRSATAAAPPTPRPPPICSDVRRSGRALPARSLVEDQAVLTALANDVGFELVFSRQLIAHARPGDMAIGFSTSGGSVNVIRAFEEARRRGLLTVASCGYDGGAMAASDDIDHCLVVRLGERAPHPGDAGRADVRAVVDGPERCSASGG